MSFIVNDTLASCLSLNRTKERRVAAFELATMAATSDDNKFRIVAEGGCVIVIRVSDIILLHGNVLIFPYFE